jgi:thiol-disulfide isomerase/thioredoxin
MGTCGGAGAPCRMKYRSRAMSCPKCAWEQAAGTECERCGVVLSKHRAAPRSTPGPEPPAPESTEKALRVPLTILALGFTALGVLWHMTRPAPLPPPRPRPVTTPMPRVARRTPAATEVPIEAPVVESAPTLSAATPEPVIEEVKATCPLLGGVAPSPPRVSSRWEEGADGFNDASREQARSRIPMVVYFFTDWCPYCRAFQQQVIDRGALDGSLRLLKVRVNPEKGPANEALAGRFGVRSYPRLFLLFAEESPTSLSTTSRGLQDAAQLQIDITNRVDSYARQYLTRARQQRGAGDLGDALSSADVAVALSPERADVYVERGKVYRERGDAALALGDFQAAYALGVFEAKEDLFASTVAVLERAGRHPEAVACGKLAPPMSGVR